MIEKKKMTNKQTNKHCSHHIVSSQSAFQLSVESNSCLLRFCLKTHCHFPVMLCALCICSVIGWQSSSCFLSHFPMLGASCIQLQMYFSFWLVEWAVFCLLWHWIENHSIIFYNNWTEKEQLKTMHMEKSKIKTHFDTIQVYGTFTKPKTWQPKYDFGDWSIFFSFHQSNRYRGSSI